MLESDWLISNTQFLNNCFLNVTFWVMIKFFKKKTYSSFLKNTGVLLVDLEHAVSLEKYSIPINYFSISIRK